jgi:cytochrome c-type biogenesis protein CcmE
MQRRIQILIGGVIVAAILAGIVYQGVQTTVAFYTPAEVLAAPESFRDKTIRIMAMVEPQSTRWDADAVRLAFKITEDSRQFIPVEFRGVKPDMYREGQGIVVEGRLDPQGTFQATNLLVKHSEEYKADPALQDKVKAKEAAYRRMREQK